MSRGPGKLSTRRYLRRLVAEAARPKRRRKPGRDEQANPRDEADR